MDPTLSPFSFGGMGMGAADPWSGTPYNVAGGGYGGYSIPGSGTYAAPPRLRPAPRARQATRHQARLSSGAGTGIPGSPFGNLAGLTGGRSAGLQPGFGRQAQQLASL